MSRNIMENWIFKRETLKLV